VKVRCWAGRREFCYELLLPYILIALFGGLPIGMTDARFSFLRCDHVFVVCILWDFAAVGVCPIPFFVSWHERRLAIPQCVYCHGARLILLGERQKYFLVSPSYAPMHTTFHFVKTWLCSLLSTNATLITSYFSASHWLTSGMETLLLGGACATLAFTIGQLMQGIVPHDQ
jgi:hypothetical protein